MTDLLVLLLIVEMLLLFVFTTDFLLEPMACTSEELMAEGCVLLSYICGESIVL